MDFTPQQAEAITQRAHNLVVTAGAGSGKTRVLVERFIHLLDQWALPDIVAITFTEKAAREMRDRVRATIAARLAKAPDAATRAHWEAHQQAMSRARIGTIHSLCAALLRANPAQVPLDPAFEVLDENEAYLLRADAVDNALLDLTDGPTAALLTAYSLRTVREVLLQFVGDAPPLLDAIPTEPDTLRHAWAELHQTFVEEWRQALYSDVTLYDHLAWRPPSEVDPADKLYAIWQAVQDLAPALDDPERVTEVLQTYKDGIKLNVGSGAKWGGPAVKTEAVAALRGIREAAGAYLDACPPPLSDRDDEAADGLMLWREAVVVAAAHYQEAKAARAVVDYDDLEAMTAALLTEHPDVAARYAGHEFKHIMVDEFQDTNERQRQIIEALAGPEPGRLFVVGDPKQSIYAFRGADVRVFHEVRRAILAGGGQEVLLNRSFRTHARLIGAFNDLFSALLQQGAGQQAAYEVDYGPGMEAHRPAPDHTPLRTPLHIILPRKHDDWDADDMRRWEAYEIARHIHAQVAAEAPVWDGDDYRPLRYGDVAILFRALTSSPLYEEVFKANNLPYLTIAGKGYYDQQEVWDVLNALRALHNPADDLALACVLRSPMVGLSDEGLLTLRLARDESGERYRLWEALTLPDLPISTDDACAVRLAHDSLTRLEALAGRIPIGELIEVLLEETAYEAIVTGLPDGDRRRGNLDKLLDRARASGRVVLGAFMRYIDDLTSIEPREGEAPLAESGAVQLMSIHKSKGLEFPMVVLADVTRRPPRDKRHALRLDPQYGAAPRAPGESEQEPFIYWAAEQATAQRDEAEKKRLFYVAATRAADYLVVTGNATGKNNPLQDLAEVFGLSINPKQDDSYTQAYDWGAVRVSLPQDPPPKERLSPQVPQVSGWDHPQAAPPDVPPLVAPLTYEVSEAARHLSVSQLENLGDPRRFRESVLHDAPAPLRPLPQAERYLRRVVGQVVHRALQMRATEHDPNQLARILSAYAWSEGITTPDGQRAIVAQARELLARYAEHDPLRGAARVLREVPFVYQLGARVLHGVVDVLYQREGVWHVLDYKTPPISAEMVPTHARRYYTQVGAYARALEAYLGHAPHAQVYYLHSGMMIDVPEDAWREALAQLEDDLAVALAPF